MKALTRLTALSLGLVGAVLALIFNILYSLAHTLGRIAGITADQSHFFIGLGLTLLAVLGSFLGRAMPEVSALLLVLATIGFFAIMGWWAIVPAIFLLLAAALTFFTGRASGQRTVA